MTHITWGIVIACGKAEALSPEISTPFLSLGSRPVLAYSLQAFEQCPDINGMVVVVDKDRIDGVLGMSQMFGFAKVQKIVAGSAHRAASVVAGLKALDEEVSIVAVHDASRPCVTSALISETVKAAKRYGSGVAAVPVNDPVKVVEKGLTVSESLKDGTLWMAQTPQTFKRDVLEKAYALASKKHIVVDDEATAVGLLEKEEVHLVESLQANLKIRSPVDFNVASILMKL